MDTTHLIRCLEFDRMPVEIRESRILVPKQAWDMFYKRKMSVITLLVRIKVYNVELADVKGSLGVVGFGSLRWEEVLPSSLEDAYARAIVPTFAAHPTEAPKVTLDDDML